MIPEYVIERVTKKALECISQYGALRWCSASICACMGCVNQKMSRVEYDIALTIPAVQKALENCKSEKASMKLCDYEFQRSMTKINNPVQYTGNNHLIFL